jgi:hypothetical protein
MTTIFWTGRCRTCKKLTSVIRSTLSDGILEPRPNRKFKVLCQWCGAENDFSGEDLGETDLRILEDQS